MSADPNLRVVCTTDSALDINAMGGVDGMDRYTLDRDPERVQELSGMKATWFTTRRLTDGEMDWVDQGTSDMERFRRAFKLGCETAEHVALEDGEVADKLVKTGGYQHLPNGGRVECWGEDELARFSRAERYEIGAVVYTRSFLGRKSVITFPPLPSCRSAWVARWVQLADTQASDQTTTPSGDTL